MLLHFTLSKIVIYGKLVPPPPPPPNQGGALRARLGFARLLLFFGAGGGGGGGEEWIFAVPFYSVQDCSFRSALGALGASLCA